MDPTELDLAITPFNLFSTWDTSPKKSLQLHQFLCTPVPSNHLKSPIVARNNGFKRKLSAVGELNVSTAEGSNRAFEKSDSSKIHNIMAITQRPSSRFSSTSTAQSKHDRHRKFPQTSIPRKSGFSVANSDQGKKKSFAERIGKSLFRAQSVAVFGKLQAQISRNSHSNKDNSIPELKIALPNNRLSEDQRDSFSLKVMTGDLLSKEKASDESDISSPLYSPSYIRNNGINDTGATKSALRRRLEKQTALLDKDGPVSLSNMFRRKSCHCTDCGGLSEFEKKHLNVVSLSKRAEFNKQKALRSRIEMTLIHLEKGVSAPDVQVSMQLEALDEDASAEGRLSSKNIMTIGLRKKSSSPPDRFVPLSKQLSFRRHTSRADQSKLDHSGSMSPLISNSPTGAMIALNDKSRNSKGSENLGDETFNLRLTLESPKRENESNKGLNLKYAFDAESPITARRDTGENRNSHFTHRSSIIEQPNSARSIHGSVLEEKRLTKNLVIKPLRNRPQKITVYAQTPTSRRDSIVRPLQLPNLDRSPVSTKRSLSTRNRPTNDAAIKGIYGWHRASSEEKSPLCRNASSCRNLKNDTQISSIDSPIKIDPLILPGLTKKNHPSRQKNLSLQTKSPSKRPQLPFENQKSARSIRAPDPIDTSKGMRTDRDSSSPINKSGKVFEIFKFKEIMSTDASDASPRKLKGVGTGKMQIGHLMKVYKKKENK